MDFMDRKEERGALEIDADELAPAIRGTRFPAGLGELVGKARENGAADEVLGVLQRLPERRYGGLTDVEEEFGRLKRAVREGDDAGPRRRG